MCELKIGWARRDVSTLEPMEIPGQFNIRVSQGILDPNTVNVCAVESNGDAVIFISMDFVAARGYLLKEIRDTLKETNPDIPGEKIIINATHTHEGPSYYKTDAASMARPEDVPHDGIDIASSDKYRAFLVKQCCDAVREAWLGRAPGGIAYGYSYAAVAYSRRVVYFDDVSKRPGVVQRPGMMVDGHARMYGETNHPNFSHFEAGTDHFLNVMFTFDKDDKITGAVVNVPCPSQCSENISMLSADYWYETRNAIRKRFGDINIVSQCAAAGDLSPHILHYKAAQNRRFKLKYGRPELYRDEWQRHDIAERIAIAVEDAYSYASKEIFHDLPVTHTVETLKLDKRMIAKEEYEGNKEELAKLDATPFKTDGTPLEQLTFNSILMARRNRCRNVLTRYECQEAEPTQEIELHVARIGNIAFASNPFELYMDFMHRIQARSPFEQTFVIQLACGSCGYLATERAVWGGGYSASIYCNIVSAQGGQQLVDETVKILNEIK